MYFTTRVGWYSGTTEKNIMENCNKSKVEEKKLQNLFENDWKQNGFRRAINNRIGGNAGGRAYTVAAKPRYARHACNNSSISSGGSNKNNIKNAKWLCEDIRILAYSLEECLDLLSNTSPTGGGDGGSSQQQQTMGHSHPSATSVFGAKSLNKSERKTKTPAAVAVGRIDKQLLCSDRYLTAQTYAKASDGCMNETDLSTHRAFNHFYDIYSLWEIHGISLYVCIVPRHAKCDLLLN